MMSLYKVILNFKSSHAKMYCDEGKSLHNPFVNLIQRSVFKQAKDESTSINSSAISTLLQTLFELSVSDKMLQSGTTFLQTVLQICLTLSSKDQKAALHLTLSGLVMFYKVKTIQDLDSSLPLLLSVYANLLRVQLKTTSYLATLCNLESHLNQAKWKYEDSLNQAKCFGLLSNGVKILTWDSDKTDAWLLKKIQHNNEILESFRRIPPVECAKKTCTLMLSMVVNFSAKQSKKTVASLPSSCFIPFLKMVGNIASVMKSSESTMSEAVHCFTEVFVLVSKLHSEEHIDRLKMCVETVLEIGEEIIHILLDSTEDSSVNVGALVSLFCE